MFDFNEILTLIIADRRLKWLITIMVLKKLGKRYAMGKLPGGRIMFADRQTKKLITIKRNA